MNLKIIFIISIFILSLTNINDPDAFTHLSLGREIIKIFGFPQTEPFNHTSLDKPFGYPEWLFAVIIYVLYAMFSSPGVVLFKAGIITLTYFVLFKDSVIQSRLIYQGTGTGKDTRPMTHGPRPLLAVVILFIIVLFVRDRFIERPEILSNLFLVFTIFSLNQFFYYGRRYIYFIPAIFILWANIHPSIIIGIYPFAAFIIGGFIQSFFNEGGFEQRKRLKIIILILFISIISSLINPHTYNILIAPKGLAADIWRYEISELRPPHWGGYKSLYIFIGIIFVSFFFNPRQSVIYAILVLPFVAMSINAIRFITLLGIVGGPVIARNISNIKLQIPDFKFLPIKAFISTSIIVLTIATIYNIGPFKNYVRTFGLSIDASNLPDGALEYLDKNNIYGRIFNTFHYGGYITFKEHPKRLTFIDGRGGHAMPDYLNAMTDQKKWTEIERKYSVDIAILEYPAVPSTLLDMERDFGFPFKGWTLVYWDTASLVYLKNDVFKDIVERDGYRYVKPANGPSQFSKRLYDKSYQMDVINELERNIKATSNPKAYIFLGFVYNEIGEFDRAVEYLNRVFEYKRAVFLFSYAHNGLGFSYIKKGNLKKALAHFKKSIEYMEDPDILYNLGIVYSQINDYDSAVYYFKKAIAIKDNMLPAYTNLIVLYRKLGYKDELVDIENAYEQRLKAVQSESHFNLAVRLYIGGKLDEALEEFKKSLEINPYSPSVHTNLGFIYYDKGNLNEAKREFINAIDITLDWADAHYGLALVYKKSGDKVNAKIEFEEYLRINPTGLWARKAREEIRML